MKARVHSETARGCLLHGGVLGERRYIAFQRGPTPPVSLSGEHLSRDRASDLLSGSGFGGLFFALHGAQKLFGWFGGDPAGETAAFARLGLEPAHLFMISSGLVEFGAGLLIAIGLFTRVAAAAATVLLTVAVLLRANGFDWTHGGFEYSALWATVCVMVLAKGGTSLSVDHAIGIEI